MDTTEIIRGLMQQRDRIDAAIAALSEVDVSQQPPVRIRRGRAVGAVALAKKVLAANGNRPMHALDIYDAIAAASTAASCRSSVALPATNWTMPTASASTLRSRTVSSIFVAWFGRRVAFMLLPG